jgi:hypothetical protein
VLSAPPEQPPGPRTPPGPRVALPPGRPDGGVRRRAAQASGRRTFAPTHPGEVAPARPCTDLAGHGQRRLGGHLPTTAGAVRGPRHAAAMAGDEPVRALRQGSIRLASMGELGDAPVAAYADGLRCARCGTAARRHDSPGRARRVDGYCTPELAAALYTNAGGGKESSGWTNTSTPNTTTGDRRSPTLSKPRPPSCGAGGRRRVVPDR